MTAPRQNPDTMARMADVFRSVFADESIDLRDEMTAEDVEGWDSIAHVSLVFAIEEEFGIRLATGDLEGIGNVGELRQAVERRLGGRSG